MVKDLNINTFDYNLPDSKIPLHPLEKRDECKLLVSIPSDKIFHRKFKELPDLLPVGSLLICNDTKVINARLAFHKDSGANIELFLLEPIAPSDYALNFQSRNKCAWKCLVGNSKKWKEGKISTSILLKNDINLKLWAERLGILEDGASEIEFSWDNSEFTFGTIIEYAGKIPIPPYLNRDSEASDELDYQTIYAKVKGSVAAPTAGLHFTPQVFENMEAHAVKTNKVTLHVGAGTFRPVKSETIGEHAMHAEPFSVSRELVSQLIEWKERRKPVVAVGTTTVRTLESLPYIGYAIKTGKKDPFVIRQWDPYDNIEDFDTLEALRILLDRFDEEKTDELTASTSIMIAPGFQWRVTDCMITNFHQPKSTLLLLVSSFLGERDWKKVYREALENDYRFLSYGDACLLIK